MEQLLNIEKASKEELLTEYDDCMNLWGKYSCDSFGYYISALHAKIVELGGWTPR